MVMRSALPRSRTEGDSQGCTFECAWMRGNDYMAGFFGVLEAKLPPRSRGLRTVSVLFSSALECMEGVSEEDLKQTATEPVLRVLREHLEGKRRDASSDMSEEARVKLLAQLYKVSASPRSTHNMHVGEYAWPANSSLRAGLGSSGRPKTAFVSYALARANICMLLSLAAHHVSCPSLTRTLR